MLLSGSGSGSTISLCLVLFRSRETRGSKFQQISNKSLSSFPPSYAYLIQVAGGVIFHLQQVVVYILDKLRPSSPWRGCLYLPQQLLLQRSLAHSSRHPPLDGNDSHGGWAGSTRHAQLQTPAAFKS